MISHPIVLCIIHFYGLGIAAFSNSAKALTASVLVLAGMGVRNLSMSAKQICIVKELLSRYTIKELKNISSKRLNSL